MLMKPSFISLLVGKETFTGLRSRGGRCAFFRHARATRNFKRATSDVPAFTVFIQEHKGAL